MSFPLEILRSGIQIADKLTKGVQSLVTHIAWIGQSSSGDDVYDDPVVLQCIVDRTNKQLVRGGEVLNVMATLTFVGDVQPNGSLSEPMRREPIDPRDIFILPDGTTGLVLESPNSVIDPETNRGLIHEVMLGPR